MAFITSVSNFFNLILQLPTVGLSILIVVVFIEIALALAVLRSNARNATNIFFFLLSLFTIFWLVASYVVRLTNIFPDSVFLESSGIFFLARRRQLSFFCWRIRSRVERLRMKLRWLWVVIVATVIVMIINMSPYAFTKASAVVDG